MRNRTNDDDNSRPFAVKAKEARRIYGWKNTYFYKLVDEGSIETYLEGKSRMVVVKSANDRVAMQIAKEASGKADERHRP